MSWNLVSSGAHGNLDEEITQLMQCKPLSEQEVSSAKVASSVKVASSPPDNPNLARLLLEMELDKLPHRLLQLECPKLYCKLRKYDVLSSSRKRKINCDVTNMIALARLLIQIISGYLFTWILICFSAKRNRFRSRWLIHSLDVLFECLATKRNGYIQLHGMMIGWSSVISKS